jgi:hypothetical protein
LVDRFSPVPATCGDYDNIRSQLIWSRRRFRFARAENLGSEVVATSHDLSAIGAAGLRALDAIAATTPLSADAQLS